MKLLASMLLALGATSMVGCNSAEENNAKFVEGENTVTLNVTGMT
ncbi:MAG: hypothetical protein O2816_06530 [Planctomycetota bacterium]|nr:hypothetical protein [Planctomycetota bacterium]